jgi:hypothetical protein
MTKLALQTTPLSPHSSPCATPPPGQHSPGSTRGVEQPGRSRTTAHASTYDQACITNHTPALPCHPPPPHSTYLAVPEVWSSQAEAGQQHMHPHVTKLALQTIPPSPSPHSALHPLPPPPHPQTHIALTWQYPKCGAARQKQESSTIATAHSPTYDQPSPTPSPPRPLPPPQNTHSTHLAISQVWCSQAEAGQQPCQA